MKIWRKREPALYGLQISCWMSGPLGWVHVDSTGTLTWGLSDCLPNPFFFLLGLQLDYISQPTLKRGEAIQQNFGQRNVSGSEAHDFQACIDARQGTLFAAFPCLLTRGRGLRRGPQGPRKPPVRKSLSRASSSSSTSCHFVLHGRGIKFFCVKPLRIEVHCNIS